MENLSIFILLSLGILKSFSTFWNCWVAPENFYCTNVILGICQFYRHLINFHKLFWKHKKHIQISKYQDKTTHFEFKCDPIKFLKRKQILDKIIWILKLNLDILLIVFPFILQNPHFYSNELFSILFWIIWVFVFLLVISQ